MHIEFIIHLIRIRFELHRKGLNLWIIITPYRSLKESFGMHPFSFLFEFSLLLLLHKKFDLPEQYFRCHNYSSLKDHRHYRQLFSIGQLSLSKSLLFLCGAASKHTIYTPNQPKIATVKIYESFACGILCWIFELWLVLDSFFEVTQSYLRWFFANRSFILSIRTPALPSCRMIEY